MKNKNKVYDSLILIMQFGINMIVPIFDMYPESWTHIYELG
jgi:hypothetical protein